ncbi:MAG: hypothetical protein CTY20_15675 [Hyphomicrobium sp.]|nr:MAG: hypothetical protein CTY20_15675 [Hyphomicrobium sp.]
MHPVRRHACWFAIAIAAVWAVGFTLAGIAQAEPSFPQLTGRIVDLSGLINNVDKQAIETEIKALEETSTDQIAVITVPSLQGYPIEDYAYQLGRKWGIGQKGKNNGILLVVAPNERKVRIEVGRGLEPLMTDVMSSIIVNNAIMPAFRRGDFSGGIRAGVRDIKDVLLGDADEVKARARGKRSAPETDLAKIIFFVIWFAIIAFVVYAHIRQSRLGPQTLDQQRRRRRGRFREDGVVILPGGWGGGNGQWHGGSGGGGWSGGGGDFGGGGASGSW